LPNLEQNWKKEKGEIVSVVGNLGTWPVTTGQKKKRRRRKEKNPKINIRCW